MALTTLGNTAFGTSSVVSASIKDSAVTTVKITDSAVTYNKLNANTAHTDRNQSFTVAQRGEQRFRRSVGGGYGPPILRVQNPRHVRRI